MTPDTPPRTPTSSETAAPAEPPGAPLRSRNPVATEDLAVELRMAIMRVSRILRTEASGDAVTPGQNSVLILLSRHGELTMRQLAEAEHVQAPGMTRTVNALESGGLVARKENPDDGRQVIITITDTGRAVLNESKRRRTAWLADKLEALPEDDRAALHRAAELLLAMGPQR